MRYIPTVAETNECNLDMAIISSHATREKFRNTVNDDEAYEKEYDFDRNPIIKEATRLCSFGVNANKSLLCRRNYFSYPFLILKSIKQSVHLYLQYSSPLLYSLPWSVHSL